MTPEIEAWVKILGPSAIFLIMLRQIYLDGKTERAEMLDLLRKMQPEIESIKTRITRLETEFDIYDPPTKPKRPAWIGDDGEINLRRPDPS